MLQTLKQNCFMNGLNKTHNCNKTRNKLYWVFQEKQIRCVNYSLGFHLCLHIWGGGNKRDNLIVIKKDKNLIGSKKTILSWQFPSSDENDFD